MEQLNTKKIPLIKPKKLLRFLPLIFLVVVIPILILAAKTVQDIRNRAYEPTSTTAPITPSIIVGRGCRLTGCNNEICTDSTFENRGSICVWIPQYACLKYSRCEKQASGSCDWTPTSQYQQCLANISTTPSTSITPTYPPRCTVGDPNSCPRGYTCVQPSPPTTCTGTNCPSLMPALPRCVPDSTPTTRACNLADPNSCPQGYTCQQSTIQCFRAPCPSTNIATCVPTGPTPTTSPTPSYFTCTVGNTTSCPKGYVCQIPPQPKCFREPCPSLMPALPRCVPISPTATTTADPALTRADINRDGLVDLSDYSLLVRDFLKTGTGLSADINLDNIVDISDYSLLVKYFLKTVPR